MYKEITLDYNFNELEPYIDSETMQLHYSKLYKKYLNNLNKALEKNNFEFNYPKEEIIKNIEEFNLNSRDEILFNLGGVLNHEMYFKNMSPKKNNQPIGKIKEKIEEEYVSFENFKKEFKSAALNLVGSGYTNLVIDKENNLRIINTSNQELPEYYGFKTIISMDLWEHAYYLKYKTEKEQYIDAFFQIINFDNINKNYIEKTQK